MKSDSLLFYFVPKLQDILFVGLVWVVTFNSMRLFPNGDLGRHITIGNYIIDNRSIPTKDVFSFRMRGRPLFPHEWLAEVLFSALHKALGMSGNLLLVALIIAVTFSYVYKETLHRGAFRLVGLLISLWAASASGIHWLVRPHVSTFLFVAIWAFGPEHVVQEKPWQFGVSQ